MNKASEALADVRGWLCDNLSESDAGKVCGMLSVVSRHIAELEDENARLRSCLSDDAENARQIMGENAKLRELVRHLYDYRELYFRTGIYPTDHGVTERRMQELGIEV